MPFNGSTKKHGLVITLSVQPLVHQIINLKHGINNVGIPDIIILQNVINNNLSLISIDKHFNQMKNHFDFSFIEIKSSFIIKTATSSNKAYTLRSAAQGFAPTG